MSDSLLKKEFKESDLTRIRNIVTKKYGDKTKTQVGYQKEHKEHKEGEIFEENGKNWIIKNGIKMAYSKLGFIKKILRMPLSCPNCSCAMKTFLDKRMYSIHKKCFDCVVKYETQLKVEGKYDEYVKNMINAGVNSFIKDLENELIDFVNQSDEQFISENGEIEEWNKSNINKKQIQDDVQNYIKSIKSTLGF